MTKNKNT